MGKDLVKILQDCGAIKFGDFTLTSGKKSRYYMDVKKAVTRPKILEHISNRIVMEIMDRRIKADYIACVELGGVPLGTALSLDTGIPLIIVRKQTKDHGIKDRLIGDFTKGKTVILVEDVVTTGGSAVSAVQALRNEGLMINIVISVVDREEGAEENFNKEGLTSLSLVKAKTLLDEYTIKD